MMTSARLQTEQLTIGNGGNIIYRQLNLLLRPGEVWGVLGANGSGKTTLLHTLAGLLPAIEGKILLHGDNVTDLQPKNIARQLGILFQEINTAFPQTVWEYCLAGRYPHLSYYQRESTEDKNITLDTLRKMNLEHLQHKNIHQLSGGEKRRLAIAALLVQTPEIYLLDEPGNHLDVRSEINVLRIFRSLAQTNAATVMMTLHDASLARHFCDHVLLLFPDGETLHGRTAEVLDSDNLSRLYQHRMQAIHYNDSTYWMPEY